MPRPPRDVEKENGGIEFQWPPAQTMAGPRSRSIRHHGTGFRLSQPTYKTHAIGRRPPPSTSYFSSLIMCLYRAYDQPGKRNARLRIPTFVSQNELFSPDLKSLCIENIQERIPPTPEDCPRCEAHLPRFVLQPGFKRGLAGAIIFVVRGPRCCPQSSSLTNS